MQEARGKRLCCKAVKPSALSGLRGGAKGNATTAAYLQCLKAGRDGIATRRGGSHPADGQGPIIIAGVRPVLAYKNVRCGAAGGGAGENAQAPITGSASRADGKLHLGV